MNFTALGAQTFHALFRQHEPRQLDGRWWYFGFADDLVMSPLVAGLGLGNDGRHAAGEVMRAPAPSAALLAPKDRSTESTRARTSSGLALSPLQRAGHVQARIS